MKKIYLIDGNSFIYRMFYGLPEFITKEGKVVNAIFGMAKFFIYSLTKYNPDYLIFIKDAKGDNFRHKIYKDYKATRDRMPDNLRSQIYDIENMIKLMGIDIIEIEGYEADDVIGTLSINLGKNKNNKIYILSSDKDLYSLITDNVFVYDTMKNKIFNKVKCEEKFGVKPNMIIDYLSIVGDKADNIPGIEGFGPQKAIKLINEIGTVEKIFLELDSGKNLGFKGKTLEKLLNSKQNAFLSKKLATIELSIDLGSFNLEKYIFKPEGFLNDKTKKLFKEFEFFSLLGDTEQIRLKSWSDLGLKIQTVKNKKQLDELYKKIQITKQITLDTETTSLNIVKAKLVGISIYLDNKNIYYINRLHNEESVFDKDLKKFLENIFNLDILIIGYNIKYKLEIIELFKKNILNNNSQNIGQMSLGL